MSGPRLSIPILTTLAAALLWLSPAPVLAAGGRGGGGGRGGAVGGGRGGGARGGAVVVGGGSRGGGYRGGAVVVGGGGYRGGAVVVGGGGYRGGYSGGYRSGYYGGGYRSGYYGGGYNGLYAPGYFSGVGVSYSPDYGYSAYAPDYGYPAQPAIPAGGAGVDVNGPPPDQPPPQPPDQAPPDGAAAVTVIVPGDAQLFFNGDATRQQGEQREFVTPVLPPGRPFQYTVRAVWKANGQTIDQTRTAIVHANARTVVDFTRAEPLAPPVPAPPAP